MTHRRAVVVLAAAVAFLVSGCGGQSQGENVDPALVDSTALPELGVCRNLTPADVEQPANATKTVECSEKHTAQTFYAAELPEEFADAAYDDESVGEHAYATCSKEYGKFLGADESLVLRTIVSWAWFRPSETAWDEGARWFRCDVVGGASTSEAYRPLPETAEGLLLGRPDDRWLVCAAGPVFEQAEKVPCSGDHDWRAVSAIKVGEPEDEYPGDEVVASRTDAFCRSAVQAWLNYPATFEFAYTYFHEAEWNGGNRRSVCWAKTSE
jgi:hypothetical protein